ncbi:DUF2382 domain-containing protein [Streptomyces sp. WMMB 322]|uniref:DUF2382 domain-containing protein n=1 Tax=Streptomyces sp. WMMB 322 TaxID=1286821 RepID=UPI0006E43218|nr:PRC and DUF2382 domain-containing protein [Streptomyces sp. WMMB 322]SCK39219.1 PRC-barrel domain-containing protein [Streptomyces sp. WMMB 322]
MISQEQIPAVVDHMIYDPDGKKIGEARHVFLDERTGEPEWATVRTGLFGTQETFVPIHEGRVVGDNIEVPFRRTKVKEAPHMDVSRGRLTEQQERELYSFYGLAWDGSQAAPEAGGEAQGTAAGAGTRTAEAPEAGAAAGAAGAAGVAGATGAAGEASTGATPYAGEAAGAAAAPASAYATGQDAMTRSEEHLHVGTQRYETGRARLLKYVVTEEVEQAVPVRHEEVRLEREPITDANREAAMSGPEISEDSYEVVLHDERPVTEVEAVPVERIRLVTEEHVRQETVRGTVRKERIEVEGIDDSTAYGSGGTAA